MTLTRQDIVAEARAWIGTPYRHQGSLKGIGCDCLGLVRGVWRGVIGAEPERAPPYAPDWRRRPATRRWRKRRRGILCRLRSMIFVKATCCCFAGALICR